MSEIHFNTSGACVPGKHYMIDPVERFSGVRGLTTNEKYFILHAPRQTGKTTTMIEFAEKLNAEGDYIALYINIEAGQAVRNDVDKVNGIIIRAFRTRARVHLPKQYQPSAECYQDTVEFGEFLSRWCLELPKPLVVFMDEVDALIGDSLLSVLRQLRNGYDMRPKAFPHAMCLISLRDIRDYRIFSTETQKYVIGGSAFNIKEKSCTIDYFTREQVYELFQQHTKVTGQKFNKDALDLIYDNTLGQPWLVNALGRELCFEEHAPPREHTITVDDVKNATQILIKRRDVHLDQLIDKVNEPRVQRVLQPILLGEAINNIESSEEDQQYLVDLGLIRRGAIGFEIANPIYQEIIPRQLTAAEEPMIAQDPRWYVKDDGRLDVELLLERMINYFKEHGEIISQRKNYNEAAYHLMFMTWIHRIVNGGGRVTREYATGLKRIDLLVEFADERFAFELKTNRNSTEVRNPKVLNEGLTQLKAYLDRLGLDFGYLVIFRRTPPDDWEAVGQREVLAVDDKSIEVIWF